MKRIKFVSAGALSVCVITMLTIILSITPETAPDRQVISGADIETILVTAEPKRYEEAATIEAAIDIEAEYTEQYTGKYTEQKDSNTTEQNKNTGNQKTAQVDETVLEGLYAGTFNKINRATVLRNTTDDQENVYDVLGKSLQEKTMHAGVSGVSLVYTDTAVKQNDDSRLFLLNTEKAEASELQYVYNEEMVKRVTDEEFDILCRIVEAEATGEKTVGKILVANVILNRVNIKSFPDTIEEVVFQKIGDSYQFSPTKDGRYWTVEITDSTVEAVERALGGEDYSQGALFFFERARTSAKKAAWFDSLTYILKFGCHEFFR